jgi:glutamate 5-kinase
MNDSLRHEITSSAQRVVVKVGTRVLSHADGRLNRERVGQLADELHRLAASGRAITLVSSGAVGAGLSALGWDRRPDDLARLQAVAAIGQAKLIEEYDRHLRRHDRHAAQVLLTVDDLDHRSRYLNVRNTLLTLLELGAIPIINENDTVAVDELMATFGDNDRLAAVVTNLLRASLLVILSDVEGLYDGDPSEPTSQRINTVVQIDQKVQAYVRDRLTGRSKGGMASKLEAARMLTRAGENVIIASGHPPGILDAIFRGEPVGTLFLAQGKSISPWKRWIGFSAQPKGSLTIDAGAAEAVRRHGRSLLPIGVVSLSGSFEKGDVVAVLDENRREIARGLTNYAARELQQIIGLRTSQIGDVLGHRPYDESIHRDNMVLTESLG